MFFSVRIQETKIHKYIISKTNEDLQKIITRDNASPWQNKPKSYYRCEVYPFIL